MGIIWYLILFTYYWRRNKILPPTVKLYNKTSIFFRNIKINTNSFTHEAAVYTLPDQKNKVAVWI